MTICRSTTRNGVGRPNLMTQVDVHTTCSRCAPCSLPRLTRWPWRCAAPTVARRPQCAHDGLRGCQGRIPTEIDEILDVHERHLDEGPRSRLTPARGGAHTSTETDIADALARPQTAQAPGTGDACNDGI
ncbi:hypothetical protein HBB16_16230 [Pseudonocardia sp. MCCB 268]|nr:hypothetical protein [Pseudonocardia cytotoxica]